MEIAKSKINQCVPGPTGPFFKEVEEWEGASPLTDTGAAKEVLLSQRGISDIWLRFSKEALHNPFLLGKERERGICFRETDPYL